MNAVSVTKAREMIFQLIAEINSSGTPVIITNSRGKNAVLIGEDDWNAIQESLYLNSVPGMAGSIIEGGQTPLEDCLTEDEVEW